MTVVRIDEVPPTHDVAPGWDGRFVHTQNLTVARWIVSAGTKLPAHAHPNEQITIVLSGEFEFRIGETITLAGVGCIAVVPGGVEHSGVAVSDCELMDVFYPKREEYRVGSAGARK